MRTRYNFDLLAATTPAAQLAIIQAAIAVEEEGKCKAFTECSELQTYQTRWYDSRRAARIDKLHREHMEAADRIAALQTLARKVAQP